MMNARERRASGLVLAGLFAAAAAHAQEVHKCTVNGSVTYQAKPCPSGDVVLPAVAAPTEQDTRQAQADRSRQHWQAATGQIFRRQIVPPPPPPPPPVQSTTTQTTVIVIPSSNGRNGYVIRETTRTPPAPPPPPLNNCEKLSRDNAAAVDKRDQLKAPSDLASHAQMLQSAEDEVTRIQQLASASNCKLGR